MLCAEPGERVGCVGVVNAAVWIPTGLRLRLVTSQGSPYPSRAPRAHPSGRTRTQGLIRWLVSYMPLVIFCAWHFCPVRPSWSSVGLLHRPLGYYIVRSPQLDERFGPALYWSR